MPAPARLTNVVLTADLSSHSPQEIDTVLEALHGDRASANLHHGWAWESVLREAGAKKNRFGRIERWDMTRSTALEIVRAKASTPDADKPWLARSAEKVLADLDAKTEALAAVEDKIAPLNAEFLRCSWTRAFIVLNTGGHLHSSMDCSTCFERTAFGWLPQASGLDEAEIVQAAGETACTVCYPSAPVDVLKRERARWLYHSTEEDAVLAREQRAADKEAKRQKAIADGLTEDGSPLRVVIESGVRPADYFHAPSRGKAFERVEEFKTERAAMNRLVASLASKAQGHTYGNLTTEVEDFIITAMANKHGATLDAMREVVDAKVEAKIKRDRRG